MSVINPGGPIKPVSPPSLADWASQHLTALYEAKTEEDFGLAFTSFFSTQLKATFNGKPISRDAYQSTLWQSFSREKSVQFTILNEVVSPGTGDASNAPATTVGTVGLTYSAHFIQTADKIPEQLDHTVGSTLIIDVEEDDTVPLGPIHPGDTIDLRRVVSLTQALFDKPGIVALTTQQ